MNSLTWSISLTVENASLYFSTISITLLTTHLTDLTQSQKASQLKTYHLLWLDWAYGSHLLLSFSQKNYLAAVFDGKITRRHLQSFSAWAQTSSSDPSISSCGTDVQKSFSLKPEKSIKARRNFFFNMHLLQKLP